MNLYLGMAIWLYVIGAFIMWTYLSEKNRYKSEILRLISSMFWPMSASLALILFIAAIPFIIATNTIPSWLTNMSDRS